MSSSAKKLEKSLSLVSDRKRDKMASSDWEFPDALPSMTSLLESLNSSSAVAVWNSMLITDKLLTANKTKGSQFKKKSCTSLVGNYGNNTMIFAQCKSCNQLQALNEFHTHTHTHTHTQNKKNRPRKKNYKDFAYLA